MAGKIVIRDARDRPSSTANTANFLIPCPNGASRRVGLVWPRWGKSTTAFPVSERRPRSRFHALKGHRIPAQGANSGIPPGKTNLRSEGTPHHFRVSDLDPGTPYAVFLQNTLILWDAVPRAMPWAGMRYPFRVHYTITISDTVGLPRLRYPTAHHVSDTGRRPRSRFHALKGHRVPLGWLYGHVGVNCPCLIPIFPCLKVGFRTD